VKDIFGVCRVPRPAQPPHHAGDFLVAGVCKKKDVLRKKKKKEKFKA
jgi:hypothetical protein